MGAEKSASATLFQARPVVPLAAGPGAIRDGVVRAALRRHDLRQRGLRARTRDGELIAADARQIVDNASAWAEKIGAA